jgi:hypothetical protein
MKVGSIVKLRPKWKCGTFFQQKSGDVVGGSMSPEEVAVVLELNDDGTLVKILCQGACGWIWSDVLRVVP